MIIISVANLYFLTSILREGNIDTEQTPDCVELIKMKLLKKCLLIGDAEDNEYYCDTFITTG